MAWVYLVVAIALEVLGTTSMKFSEGFTKVGPSVLIFVFYGLAFVFLTLALRTFDVGMAYAIWAGSGTAIVAFIGILLFGEPATALKFASIALIVVGVVGLNLGGAH